MARRYLIRLCFLLPILYCLASWAWTLSDHAQVTYAYHGYFIGSGTHAGVVALFGGRQETRNDGWDYRRSRFTNTTALTIGRDSFYGFRFRTWSFSADSWALTAAVPHWFLIALFSVLSILVWRRTSPRPDPRTAFPVDLLPQPH